MQKRQVVEGIAQLDSLEFRQRPAPLLLVFGNTAPQIMKVVRGERRGILGDSLVEHARGRCPLFVLSQRKGVIEVGCEYVRGKQGQDDDECMHAVPVYDDRR